MPSKPLKLMRCNLLLLGLVSSFPPAGVGAETEKPQLGEAQLAWELPTAWFLPQSILPDQLGRPYLFVAQKKGGLSVLDISDPRTPTPLTRLQTHEFQRLDPMYVTQQGDYLYLALGDSFSPRGAAVGLAIVDVQRPQMPRLVSVWRSDQEMKGSAVVLVDGEYAYLGAMKNGVFIFDISNKQTPQLISSIQPDIHFPKRDPNTIQHPNARGIALHEDLLYVCNDAGGLRVIDVADKANPKEISKYINSTVKGKPQAYNGIVIDWPYAYVAVDYCGMEVLDISKAKRIKRVGWWNPWNCDARSNYWFNSRGHTNQLALARRQKLIFVSAGDSELQVVDVSRPRHPTLVANFGEPKNKLGVWGVAVDEKFVYLAYIKAIIPFRGTWSGIKAVSRASLVRH